jgi:hypothetical protein
MSLSCVGMKREREELSETGDVRNIQLNSTSVVNTTKRIALATTASATAAPSSFVRDGNTTSTAPMTSGGGSSAKGKGQGLRHFSLKVCEKVEEKGTTTYNEVADELVKEFMSQRNAAADDSEEDSSMVGGSSSKKGSSGKNGTFDEKNIRRRVYDALNVLMAMDIIYKEKKEIRWNGLPSNINNDVESLQREKIRRLKDIQQKRECLKELLLQHVCYSNLVQRNKEQRDQPQDSSTTDGNNNSKIPVPFIVVNTSNTTVVQCEMGPDRTDVFFNFSKPFEINDDKEILKRMGMNRISYQEFTKMIPRDMLAYCQYHRLLDTIVFINNNTPAGIANSAISTTTATTTNPHALVPPCTTSSSSYSFNPVPYPHPPLPPPPMPHHNAPPLPTHHSHASFQGGKAMPPPRTAY